VSTVDIAPLFSNNDRSGEYLYDTQTSDSETQHAWKRRLMASHVYARKPNNSIGLNGDPDDALTQ